MNPPLNTSASMESLLLVVKNEPYASESENVGIKEERHCSEENLFDGSTRYVFI